MNHFKFFSSLFIIAISFVFIQCTSEPIAGPAGEDGADGTNGTNGVDGTTSCVTCHSNTHRDPINSTFALSIHDKETLHETTISGVKYTYTTSDYTDRTGCVECHTSEGYIDYVSGNTLKTGTGLPTQPAYPAGKQGISCVTCHDKHTTFDFAKDGPDYALRTIKATKLKLDGSMLDFGNTSNNCVTCHQPREATIPGPTADYAITSSRFGPHHGPQATLVQGILGANVVGSIAYPTPGTSSHVKNASCVSCHMGTISADGTMGGHSWAPNEEAACKKCHSTIPTEVTNYTADMTTLKNLLIAKGAMTASGSIVPATYPAKVAQAVWNYQTLTEDKSKGIHNPNYVKALLKNSIEALQ